MIKAKERLIGNISAKQTLSGKLNNGIEKVYPALQEKTAIPSGEIQEIVADDGVYGLSKVTVNKVNLQDKTVDPTTEKQIISADSEFTGLNEVTINPIFTQEKIVTPTKDGVTIIPDENKFLSKVDVLGDNNLIPENIAEGKTIFGVNGTGKIEQTQWQPEPDWWDIDAIYNDFKEQHPEYPFVAVVLLKSNGLASESVKGPMNSSLSYDTPVIKNDGEETTIYKSSTEYINWDLTKDKPCSKGYSTRYIITYSTRYYEPKSILGGNSTNFLKEASLYIVMSPDLLKQFYASGTNAPIGKHPNLKAIKVYTNENGEIPLSFFYSLKGHSYCPNIETVIADKPLNPIIYGADTYNNIQTLPYKYPFNFVSFPSNKPLNIGHIQRGKHIKVENQNILGTGDYIFYEIECEKIYIAPHIRFSSLRYAFQRAVVEKVNDDDTINCEGVTSLYWAFDSCRILRKIILKNSENITDWTNAFSQCFIRELTLDISGATKASNIFNQCYFRRLIFVGEIPISISYTYAHTLPHEDLINILVCLKDLTGQTAQTLTIGPNAIKLLSDDEKAIPINKNWTIA